MKTLTLTERARRAAALGIIVLPGPPAPDAAPSPAPASRSSGKVRAPLAGKLTAPPALRAKLALPIAEPPAPEQKPLLPVAAPIADQPLKCERKRALNRERYLRAHRLLASRWPAIFGAARPLAIGIDKQVRAILSEEELSGAELRVFFYRWTHRVPYRAALERGDRRVNLDGSDAGAAFEEPPQGGSAPG